MSRTRRKKMLQSERREGIKARALRAIQRCLEEERLYWALTHDRHALVPKGFTPISVLR